MVRVRFDLRSWDLIIAVLYTLAAGEAILVTGVGSLWALLLVIFVPGYVVVSALFPGHGLGWRFRTLRQEGERLRVVARSDRLNLEADDRDRARVDAEADAGRVHSATRILEDSNERLRASLGRRSESGLLGSGLEPPLHPGSNGHGIHIDWVERIALSFGLSIAVVALLGLLLDATVGIGLQSIIVSLLVFTVLVAFLAYVRRLGLPTEDRLSPGGNLEWRGLKASSLVDKALVVALAMSIVFAATTTIYVVITPRSREHFTQFYLLDANNSINNYPTVLKVSQPSSIVIGIKNNESAQVSYTVEIDRLGVVIVKNATSGLNQTAIVNTTRLVSFNVNLNDRTSWEHAYPFTIDWVGIWEMNFLLFRDNNFASPYRNVYLFVNVTR